MPSRLLFVADSRHAPAGLPALFARAAAAGLDFLELRRKDPMGTADRVAEARACLAAAPGATVLINDRLDVALAAGAQGAHVGQDDLPVAEARRLLGPERLLGLSTHDEGQFARALGLPVDYLALGPIFDSRTKSGHAPAVGLESLRRVCESTRLPVVAIGGLDPERARAALDAGAAAVAVAAGLAAVGDFEAAVDAYRAACGREGPVPWVLTGLPGAGKSTVGRELARLSGRAFIDLDERIVEATGRSIAGLFVDGGEAAFRRAELEALRAVLAAPGPPPVLASGGGTVTNPDCRKALRAAGALLIWLQVSPALAARRLAGAVEERPLLFRPGAAGDLEQRLRTLLDARSAAYGLAGVRLSADDDPEGLARRLLALDRLQG